jgi:hypothetical protein
MASRGDGMVGMDKSVRQQLRAGKISRAAAEQHARDPTLLGL